ncbi:MAG TPA: ATP-binding protein [Acidimicrobiales bacterium]|nr:ATP-binding protein [Acidimicrobiales bacterium]
MADQHTFRVVLVDDVPEIREILAVMLEQSGRFQVVGHASTGQEAIAVAIRERPDAVVLDIDMPGMSGWEALGEIREAVPFAQVVILSGAPEDVKAADDETRSMAAVVLEKGITGTDLVDQLLEVLSTEPQPLPPVRPQPPQLDAVVDVGLDGVILGWNAAAGRLYDYDARDAVGRPFAMLVHPDRADELDDVLARVREGRRLDYCETVHVTSDATPIDVATSIAPVHDGAGRLAGASITVRDVTMRRHSAAALARAVAQLERQNRELTRSNEELDSFAYVASHDLAQPLQVAYGYLEMLREDYGSALDPTAQEWLAAALGSLERMRRLVRDILRYSRSGATGATREPVDLEDVVADVVEALDLTLEEADAHVQMGVLPVVLGDAGQIGQVLQNLITNAVKFRRPDEPPLVRITAEATAPEEVEITVADNGVGVAEEHRERVFEMFQRGGAGDVAGTGLGLAICRKIIARHGGRISLDARPDGPGTVVRFTLPTA